ncbi:hypothetical protein M2480_002833 [Parabacteroides sp. PFB2-12]|uniref:hypothetical protein n=1 Tax=unclassified Parabacteroides TaxID=2649774 RepID=UPI0024763160|nr:MULTISPECIES: hypothetical protein [unclassified Parabacteroides]MDH6344074.1 hypothetical protein [Parabacteroides sp. PM6-13]MDH6391831.1 hypothetical protein [Parabacteroides sp. PFB2-12]
MNKIFIVTFVAISVLFSFDLSAQQNDQKQRNDRNAMREAFEAKRNAFITAEMGLTPEEAAAFIPLCDELRRKKFEVGHECRMYSRGIEKKENPTPEEYTKATDVCTEVAMKEAQLEKEYYERFKKILAPEKLYKYREAEMKFARQLMREGGPRGDEHRREQNRNNNK